MKNLRLVITFAWIAIDSFSQPPEFGSNLSPTTSPLHWQFDEFHEGRVYFRYNMSTAAKLNYSYVHGAIEFLSGHGDTLLLDHPDRVERILIGPHVYFSIPGGGEVELVENFGNIRLTVRRQLIAKASHSYASDQRYSATTNADIPSSLLISSSMGEVRWQNTTHVPDRTLKTSYFLIDRNGMVFLADRTAFLKIYSRDKRQLLQYFRENRVNFENEENLKKLLNHCREIGKS
jgi:hypothetical protein